MDIDKINKTISQIEKAITKELWLDFDIMNFNGRTLLVTGTIDRTYKHTLEILFEDVFAILSPTEWTWDKKENSKVLELLNEDESKSFNLKYSVVVDHKVFRFNAENIDNGCIIIAKSIILQSNLQAG
jgi:hypothetical protein